MAYLETATVAGLIDDELPGYTDRTLTTRAALAGELEAIRARGPAAGRAAATCVSACAQPSSRSPGGTPRL